MTQEEIYDNIMSEAERVYKYQIRLKNPYAMHDAVERAYKLLTGRDLIRDFFA